MLDTEREQVAAATVMLERVRQVRVRFTASWTRLDDLEPEAEQSLREALQSAWDTWTADHGVADGCVQGPNVIVRKLDYIPSIDGEV